MFTILLPHLPHYRLYCFIKAHRTRRAEYIGNGVLLRYNSLNGYPQLHFSPNS